MVRVADAVPDYFTATRPGGVVSAYLFGSHARGSSHREGDVDVAVLFHYGAVADRAERGRRAVALTSDLIAATHRNEVDVVVLNDAPAELAAAVVCRGVRVYCADQEAEHAFVRTTLLRYADLKPFLERTRRLRLAALAR